MNIGGECIFCRSGGPFKGVEHPIPESLGNDDLILPAGFVCDPCNQYFGAKIEQKVLSSPPWSVERTAAAIRTKKGRFAKHIDKEVRLHSTGCWDGIFFEADRLASLPLIRKSDGSSILLVSNAPKADELVARFLLKMGIELLTLTSIDVRSGRFQQACQYARFGRCKGKWEVAYGLYPTRKDLVKGVRVDQFGSLETRQLYQYEMGEMQDGRIILSFTFINHVYAICLSHSRLGRYLEAFNEMNLFSLRSNISK